MWDLYHKKIGTFQFEAKSYMENFDKMMKEAEMMERLLLGKKNNWLKWRN